MLIEFQFRNYRSFRDAAVLSMEAVGLGAQQNNLIPFGKTNLLPCAAIYGKNGGGKSNVIRALWLSSLFILNAQKTQHENARVPVRPFLLNEYSRNEPTSFEYVYVMDDVKYWYGFSATEEKIIDEYLYHAPNGQKAMVFHRNGQNFRFTKEHARRNMIKEAVAENQLYFSVACIMNDAACKRAMKWFRERVFFSRDYADLPKQLPAYSDDTAMLDAISDYAKAADLGIEDVRFEFHKQEIKKMESLPEDLPEGVKAALMQLAQALSDSSPDAERRLRIGHVTASLKHQGKNREGANCQYELALSDESDGTRRLMSLAPAIENALRKGGLLLVDELEREMHPTLVEYLVAKFQSRASNPKGAQLIFTTHNMELLDLRLLRKDQIYLVEKSREDGVSELYSISDFHTRTTDNIRKAYLAGRFGAVPELDIEEVV